MKYDVFLSYASEDRRRIQQLYRRLRQSGLSCWMDKPPRPWQQEGISPGEDWDSVIRRRLSDARVILAILSHSSVTKRGYIQKEFRLALQVAAEYPPNAIAVIPVLIEECQPPELKVDTISFQKLQWYELFKYGVQDLIQILRRTVGWQAPSFLHNSSQPERSKSGHHMTPLMEFISTLDMPESTDWRNKPFELFKRALTFVRVGDFEAAEDQVRPIQIKDKSCAVHAIQNITDRHIATLGIMLLIHYIPKQSDRSLRRIFRKLEKHAVPEVRLLATAYIASRGLSEARLLKMLRDYADSSERLLGFHDLLRWHLHFESIWRFANTHPRFLWELVANNPQFSMKGMRFLPMTEEGRKLSALASSPFWETREIGVGIYCADASIPLEAKLRFLSDEEPRVRFRALEGILMDWRSKDMRPIIQALIRESEAKNGSRRWTVKLISGKPLLYVVHLDDTDELPMPLTNGFGHGSIWFLVEAADVTHCQLSGLAAISPTGREIENEDRPLEKMLLARVKKNNRHWIYEVMKQKII